MTKEAPLLPLDLALGNYLRRHRTVTIAALMKAGNATRAEAHACLREFEALGRLVRTGGGPGAAFVWSAHKHERRGG